ncbi:hypothetical protein RHSIM_Rhsim09G0038000 [Rhododendron simsii]|uniref:Uncharacterized protein n=1 Tax=Rhododendron simsii TaxID=118357 RepID=A0A834LDB6_RHOSS|nr:hypothetical protein RHSIM_Rhsim09G0038000 [Rhododendron simsii]
MDFKSFMGLVFLTMGGGLIFLGVFFKDFCIPGGGSGCFSICSSRICAADQAERMVGDCDRSMAFKSFMGLVFSAMGGGPIFPSVFFKDFCIPGGGSGCLSMRSSKISVADRTKRMVGDCGFTTK